MSERLSIEQKIQQYRQANPKLNGLSDKQILSVMVENGEVTLSEAQKVSIYSNSQSNVDNQGLTVQKQTKSRTINLKSGRKIVIKDGTAKYYAADGVELKREYFEKQEGKIDVRPSGRYSVTKAGKTKYYAADGTELKGSYFKRVENTDVNIKGTDGKTYNLNKTLENRINKVTVDLEKSEDSNGFIGTAWSGFKNLTGIGDSSDKVREQQETEKKLLQQFNSNEQKRPEIFKELTGVDYTPENLEKFIKGEIKLKSEIALQGYNEGQEMAVDITADIVSGIAAVGIYTAAVAAAPFTGGASIAVGVVAAGASGAVIKTGLKATDAATGGREYTLQDAKHDAATGVFSGMIAPITGGLGGAAGKTVATKLGVQAVKQVGKEVAQEAAKGGVKQTVKTMLTNPTGYEYVGGNAAKRGLAFAAETATDGAVGGAVDNAFRTAYDGGSLEDIGNSAVEGFVGGAIMSPIIGGGMKAVGKGAQKAFGKDNVDIDANGNKVQVNDDETVVKINDKAAEESVNTPDAEIHIPKGILASDITPFTETDEGFRNIVRNRSGDIAELNKIKDTDKFLENGFQILKEEMGLEDSSIKLVIGNDNYYDLESNTVFINRNWQNGDKAELFGAIAHELDHFLQWKEVIRNLDEDHPMYNALLEQLSSTEVGTDNLLYVLNKYEDAPVTELSRKQAKEYADSWQNYIEPADPKTGKVDVTSQRYRKYKEQAVEAEAMRRGDIVVEEYRRAVGGIDDINLKLSRASTREDFVAIRDEIKKMPAGEEKHALQQEYFRKYSEFSREYNKKFDIKMEYSPKSNDYLQRLSKVNFSKNGGLDTREVKLYENFKRAMHKVLIATDGKADLPEDIIFREIPQHSGGIACKDATTPSISINRCFLDNIDSNIKNIVQDLKGIGMLNVDIDGKIRIPDFLKNDITLELEKKLNAYSDKNNSADKLELYTCYIGYFVDLQSQIRRHPIVTIEKIMKTGSNQTVLKKQGLFKTRQEVNAMNKGEQIAYLKEIASITGIPENTVLIRDIDQLYIHELGHLNHKLSKEDEVFLRSKKVIEEHQNNPEIQNTCSKVSRYAQQLPMEFVAEVFSGLVSGQKFDADVMSLYAKYKGPQLFN